jgi:O-antigen ligase
MKSWRFPVETGLLLALAAFLPLLEAPKNIAWLAYACVWLWNRARARDFGGPWDLWDTLFAAWIASGYLVAAFAGLDHQEWKGANDLMRYASIGWLVKRGGYSATELRWLLGALVLATLASLAGAWWSYWTYEIPASRRLPVLQMRSVGHVNHSAIYLAIMLGVCIAWIYARWQAWSGAGRAGALAVAGVLLGSLVVMASRGALAAALAVALVVALAWWPRSRVPLVATVVAAAIAVSLAIGFGADFVVKHQVNVERGDMLSLRDRIWRMGMVAWERYPWFGVGMSNYSRISLERVEEWRRLAGKPFEARDYLGNAHAHNLLVNTLAERGVVGTGALAAVLAAWLGWLFLRRPRAGDDDIAWLLWGAATSAWVVTVVAGIGNTTLHHEHGILATLLLGAWLSSINRRAS